MNTKVFDQINAVNLTEQVEPHAKRLEDAANAMQAAGIGGDLTHGHAMHLRKMAASLRCDAAQGKMPSVYYGTDRLHATAEPKRFDASTAAILDQLR
jgi:hypothetical protein